MVMNYNKMSISEGIKYPAFWWYSGVELVLLVAAIISVLKGEFLTAFTILILIELREISLNIKNPNPQPEE